MFGKKKNDGGKHRKGNTPAKASKKNEKPEPCRYHDFVLINRARYKEGLVLVYKCRKCGLFDTRPG